MSVYENFVWLECEILDEFTNKMNVRVELQDGAPAELVVFSNLVERIRGKKGRMKVEPVGEQKDLYSVRLPKPTLEYGHNITVKNSQITLP